MQQENINQLTSSRRVGMRDINALLQTAPISRIKTLRDDEGRSTNVGQSLPRRVFMRGIPDNRSCSCPPCGESAPLGAKGGLIKRAFFAPPSALQATSCAREEGNSGFTLIELLVVVLIIGILAAIALPQYQRAVLKSRAASVWPLVNAIYQAQQFYFLTHGEYADNFESLDIGIPGSNTEDGALCSVFREMSPEKGVCHADTEWVFMMTIHPNNSLIVGAAPIQASYTGSGWLKSTFLPNIHCANRNDKKDYGGYCQKLGYKNKKQSDGYISYYFQ